MQGLETDAIDVYDCSACVYPGRVETGEIQELIEASENRPDQETNDIFVMPESLDVPAICPAGPTLTALLKKHFERRDYAILRWNPVSDSGDEISTQH